MDFRYWDLRDLIDRWLAFLVGLIRGSIDVGLRIRGLEGAIIGIVLLALAATVVVIPLLICTVLWIAVRLVGLVRGGRDGAAGEDPVTTADWRSSGGDDR